MKLSVCVTPKLHDRFYETNAKIIAIHCPILTKVWRDQYLQIHPEIYYKGTYKIGGWISLINDQLSDRWIFGQLYRENGNSYVHNPSVLRKDVAPPTCVLQTEWDLGAMVRSGDICPKCQCLKTAVFGQNGRFSDSAYYRYPEAEPDIEGGLTVKNESLF